MAASNRAKDSGGLDMRSGKRGRSITTRAYPNENSAIEGKGVAEWLANRLRFCAFWRATMRNRPFKEIGRKPCVYRRLRGIEGGMPGET